MISTSSITGAGSITIAADDLSVFGQDPWWLVLIKSVSARTALMLRSAGMASPRQLYTYLPTNIFTAPLPA